MSGKLHDARSLPGNPARSVGGGGGSMYGLSHGQRAARTRVIYAHKNRERERERSGSFCPGDILNILWQSCTTAPPCTHTHTHTHGNTVQTRTVPGAQEDSLPWVRTWADALPISSRLPGWHLCCIWWGGGGGGERGGIRLSKTLRFLLPGPGLDRFIF